ncbi:PI-PLC domain-containing protein [Pareuzebyella sediminis]|uniref:interleukin-like EMT inducer domain-containing protein n=1 Tax=Pareuzebyella sediminis TaxID=2607998 RepID=UPI0011EBA6B1|nr:interleukin-like EMT inducer domain-containing protein [Pareuzebyella sediminis]
MIAQVKTPIFKNSAVRHVFFILALVFSPLGQANSEIAPADREVVPLSPTILLESHSFNAKQRSSFRVNDRTEYIERGITLLHFNGAEAFEYKTFDTYADEKSCHKLIEVIAEMQADQVAFAILAHDSAANVILQESKALKNMGFEKLTALKSRQAYIMYLQNGTIVEKVDDLSAKASFDIPVGVVNNKVYFPKITYDFEPSNDRYIAHAGGEVNGVKSTNTRDALDQNYAKGFRLFELDIIKTSDGKFVAAHDWNMWARFTDYTGELPPTLNAFNKEKIYGDYMTLDMDGINQWFEAHPDATLVTDKINEPIAFANAFVDKERLIMELFSVMAVEQATKNGINAMISQEPFFDIIGDKLNFLKINNVNYIALSRRTLSKHTELMLKLKEAGIKVYVYHVNFDPGKDERYVQENEIGLVYGMYADKWIFEGVEGPAPSK